MHSTSTSLNLNSEITVLRYFDIQDSNHESGNVEIGTDDRDESVEIMFSKDRIDGIGSDDRFPDDFSVIFQVSRRDPIQTTPETKQIETTERDISDEELARRLHEQWNGGLSCEIVIVACVLYEKTLETIMISCIFSTTKNRKG